MFRQGAIYTNNSGETILIKDIKFDKTDILVTFEKLGKAKEHRFDFLVLSKELGEQLKKGELHYVGNINEN